MCSPSFHETHSTSVQAQRQHRPPRGRRDALLPYTPPMNTILPASLDFGHRNDIRGQRRNAVANARDLIRIPSEKDRAKNRIRLPRCLKYDFGGSIENVLPHRQWRLRTPKHRFALVHPQYRRHVRCELFDKTRRHHGVHKCEIVITRIRLIEEINTKCREFVRNILVHSEQNVDIPIQVTFPMLHDGKKHHGSAVTAIGMACDENLHADLLF